MKRIYGPYNIVNSMVHIKEFFVFCFFENPTLKSFNTIKTHWHPQRVELSRSKKVYENKNKPKGTQRGERTRETS